MIKKSLTGWIIVILLSLSPLILWFFSLQPFHFRFITLSTTFTSIGNILALVGISMFSLSFVLSTRLKFLEPYFGGMNKVYVAHHIFGGTAFILLLLHPLAQGFAYLPLSIRAAALYILPGSDWAINVGISTLLFLMTLLILTFFVNIPYHIWKITHNFLGVVFFLGAIHGFFVPSDISRNLPLRIYIFGFVAIAAISYIYRTLLGSRLVRKIKYRVSGVRLLGEGVVEIQMIPIGKNLLFSPGQFVFVSFKDPSVSREWHPFSMSSSPMENVLILTSKNEGDYTKSLLSIKPNAIATIEGAFGMFSYQKVKNKNQVWIAGGIGITPFYSMAKTINDPELHIDLYYSMHDEKEAIYLPEMTQISVKNPNFRVFPYYSKTQGRLTSDIIYKISGNLREKEIFLCGPPPMMKSLRRQFIKSRVSNKRVHSEEFELR